jgi:stage V sporulation protein B
VIFLVKKLPIFYSALLLTGVNLLLRLAGTSFQVYLSARIGAEGIGLLQLVMSVGAMAMVAGMAGIRTATMYLSAEELGKGRPGSIRWVLSGCFLYSILFSGTIALVVYLTAPWLAQHWIGDIRITDAIRLYAAFLPVNCLTGVMVGYFTGAQRIGMLAAVEVAEQAVGILCTMTLLTFWSGHDAPRCCQAVIIGSGMGACLTLSCLVFLRLREKQVSGNKIPLARRLADVALPLALADDLKTGINTVENLMVPKRLGLFPGESSPLAAFGMISGMVFPILMFPACILFGLAELLIPELARCSAAGSQQRIRYLISRSLKAVLIYSLLLCGLEFLLADELCLSLYHNARAGQQLRLYAILIPMLYCDAIVDAITKGLGQQKICVRYNIITSVMDVILLYILLPKYGIVGYFTSFAITHLINFILSLRRMLKITGIRIRFHIPILSVGATVAALVIVSTLRAGIAATIFPIVLLCLLFLIGILQKEDMLWLKGLLQKG